MHIILALILAVGARAAQPEFPGLILDNGRGMGGLGRLEYSAARGGYEVVDGRFTAYVVDAGQVRAMRPDERGGIMARPTDFWTADGGAVGFLPSYNAFLKLGPDFSVRGLRGFGEFKFAGSAAPEVARWRGNTYFFVADELVAFDKNLAKVGALKLANAGWNPSGFVVEDGTLNIFWGRNTGPETDCAAPRSPDPAHPERSDFPCGERFDAALTVDVSDPAHMRLLRDLKVKDENPPLDAAFKGFDAARGEWLIVTGYGAQQNVQLRSLKNIGAAAASAPVPGRAAALTPTAPFFAVLSDGARLTLVPVKTNAGRIVFGEALDLNLRPGRLLMKRRGDRLYLLAESRLRVVDVAAAPRLALAQDFHDRLGDAFEARNFAFADGSAPAPAGVDRARVEGLLALKFLSPEKTRELQSQLERLGPGDAWAVPPLTGLLDRRGASAPLLALAARGLGRVGPAAKGAIPALLDASLQAGAIRGEYSGPLQDALARIDPVGDAVVDALPAFQARHYRPSARMVSRDVLRRLTGERAKAALAEDR